MIWKVLQSAVLLVLASGCGVSVENLTPAVIPWADTGEYTLSVRLSTNGAEVLRARALRDDGTTIELSEADDDVWEGTIDVPRCTEGFALRYRVDYQIDDQDTTQTVYEPVDGNMLFRIRNIPGDCPPGSRREFVVDDLGDAVDVTPGDGVCATSDGDCTLRAAVMESNARPGTNSVLLPEGTITLSLTEGDNRFSIEVTDNLSIRGVPLDESRQIRSTVTVDPDAGRESLEGSEISGFPFFNVGPGISVSIDAVHLTGGFGLYGGAVRNSGKLLVRQSEIDGNAGSVHGGAIYNSSTLTLEDSWLHDNSASLGGAIYNSGAAVVVRSSTLSANTAQDAGGALYAFIGEVELWNSTVSANLAPRGAGLDMDYPATVQLRSSTITENRAEDNGGGIRVENSVPGILGAQLSAGHSLIAANVAGEAGTHDIDGIALSLGANLIGICSTSLSQPCTLGPRFNTDQIGSEAAPLDPVLEPLSFGLLTPVHVPNIGSPAVDAGSSGANDANGTACTRVDQLNRIRPRGEACDIGAVER